jgi:hypothetical protein
VDLIKNWIMKEWKKESLVKMSGLMRSINKQTLLVWKMGLVDGGIMELIKESFKNYWWESVKDWCVVGG